MSKPSPYKKLHVSISRLYFLGGAQSAVVNKKDLEGDFSSLVRD